MLSELEKNCKLFKLALNQMGEELEDYYFDSYSHSEIHQTMLADKIRTSAYRDAIYQNPTLFSGKIVLDVGCGTGILSMFASKAGAKHVYAVDNSDIVHKARKIIAVNNFQNITIIQGEIENIEIPEKVDVIVSEWMGYCLFYESMLPSVILARDKFLKPGGTMWPNFASMRICGATDKEYYNRKFQFWNNVYGFNLDVFRKWALLEPIIESVSEEQLITDEHKFITFDLNKCSVNDLTINSPFTINSLDDEEMNCFVVSFDVEFKGPEKTVILNTSPFGPPTHWYQTLFYTDSPIRLRIGEEYHGMFSMKPNQKNPRDQDIEIQLKLNDEEFSQNYKIR